MNFSTSFALYLQLGYEESKPPAHIAQQEDGIDVIYMEVIR